MQTIFSVSICENERIKSCWGALPGSANEYVLVFTRIQLLQYIIYGYILYEAHLVKLYGIKDNIWSHPCKIKHILKHYMQFLVFWRVSEEEHV